MLVRRTCAYALMIVFLVQRPSELCYNSMHLSISQHPQVFDVFLALAMAPVEDAFLMSLDVDNCRLHVPRQLDYCFSGVHLITVLLLRLLPFRLVPRVFLGSEKCSDQCSDLNLQNQSSTVYLIDFVSLKGW